MIDIKSAVKSAVKYNVWMMTLHVSDFEGMRQCAEIAKEEAEAEAKLKELNNND